MNKNGKRCVVYGGGGFIGSHLVDELLSRGFDVTVFDKLNFSRKNLLHTEGSIEIIEGDFNNIVDVRKSLDSADYVFHLVSSTLPANSNDNPVYDAETNLLSSLRLFRECVEKNVKKVIFLSSGGTVYGIPETLPVSEEHPSKPICSYGIIKKAIEDYLYLFGKLYGLDYCVFRLSNPYGERQNPYAAQGAAAVFIHKILSKEEITIWGDGGAVRDYLYIKDAVEALAESLLISTNSKVFNLSSGTGTTLNELIEKIKQSSGISDVRVSYTEGRKLDVPVSVLDNSRIEKEMGWTPKTSLDAGLRRTIDHMRGDID